MNGVHDMGGMQCFGLIEPQKNQPAFEAPWEARLVGILGALGPGRHKGNWRVMMESLPPAEYLRLSYYERYIPYLVEGIIAAGTVTREEAESGKPAKGSVKAVPEVRPADIAGRFVFRPPPARKPETLPARFQAGQAVRAREINPVGHTRLPRYARGRTGVIQRDCGTAPFPDTAVYGRGANRQHVYSVRFAARELWGEQASSLDSIYLDLWEDYLAPA